MNRTLALTLTMLLAAQGLAMAATVKGNVMSVNDKNRTLTIQRTDDGSANNNLPDRIEVKVRQDAQFKNIATLNDLHTGNHVIVGIKENKDLGLWEGSSVELRNDRTNGHYTRD